LIDRRVEVYADPAGATDQSDYRDHRHIGESGDVPLVIDGREIASIPVKELLP